MGEYCSEALYLLPHPGGPPPKDPAHGTSRYSAAYLTDSLTHVEELEKSWLAIWC